MTLSVWRYAHLALAVVSSLFLLILSVTGVILAVGAVNEKAQPYRADNLGSVTLAQSLPVLSGVFPEITTLTVDHNRFVSIEGTDRDGNPVNAYINPVNGAILGDVKPQSDFIQWNIALHRSLFLKETGRIIIGLISFLLLLITLTGIVLIAKRQQGLRHFFARINKDFFSQYFHVVSGRLFLVPVLMLALTGTYLFMVRQGLTEADSRPVSHTATAGAAPKAPADFPVFRNTRLTEVEKIEFPFMPDDPEEFYIVKLKDRELAVNQITGEVVQETRYPYSLVLEKLSLNLHTGRTSSVWAIILAFASLNILLFIYTGFDMTFRRSKTKIRNRHTADTAEYVVLTGSENGSTLAFAHQVHQQLLALGYTSFLTEMNRFTHFPEARHFLIFSSTYGLGTAPANAGNFEKLIAKFPHSQKVNYSVVGFGSKAYPDFCAYARHIDKELAGQPWASRYLDLHTVNDRSAEELTAWVKAWSEKSQCALATTPALYTTRVTGLKKFKVIEKTQVTEDNATFRVVLQPERRNPFRSGDLLAVYPANDGRERLYSIGKRDGNIQLMVKLHPGGLGSEFLYALEEGNRVAARIAVNKTFHFPVKAPAVVMIANGTGIAPFLGMISENRKRVPLSLYAGFRHNNALSHQYRSFADEEIAAGRLQRFETAFSREENACYVMDLICRDAAFFAGLLKNKGTIMICGSLAMQKDVEAVLSTLCMEKNGRGLHFYKEQGQVLSDCY